MYLMILWRMNMEKNEVNKKQWGELHKNKRYRPKYPSEIVVQFVFRNFDRNGKTKILDLGCGAGIHVFFMGSENVVPYGIDFSDEGIEYTKQMLKEFGMGEFQENMKVGSLTELPYENDFFDGIICNGVLYYLDFGSIEKAVDEMKRVLKPNGKLLLVVRSNEDYRFNKKYEIEGEKNTIIISEDDETKCAHSENGMLMHFFEEEELRSLFCDLNEVKIDRITETHDNQKFCDCNYIVTAQK